MNDIAGQHSLCAVHHEERCISSSAVGRGPQPPEYGVKFLHPGFSDSFKDRTSLGLMLLIIRPVARLT